MPFQWGGKLLCCKISLAQVFAVVSCDKFGMGRGMFPRSHVCGVPACAFLDHVVVPMFFFLQGNEDELP